MKIDASEAVRVALKQVTGMSPTPDDECQYGWVSGPLGRDTARSAARTLREAGYEVADVTNDDSAWWVYAAPAEFEVETEDMSHED